MNDIVYSTMKNPEEIEFLRDRRSFNYSFNKITMDSLEKHFRLKDSLYLLVKKEERFVAFCSIDRGWWGENFFFIREILVDPDFHKRGIGEKLMSMCIEHAQNCGATGVVTETDFVNIPMQKLCEKLGFTKWENPQWKEGITYKLIFKYENEQ